MNNYNLIIGIKLKTKHIYINNIITIITIIKIINKNININYINNINNINNIIKNKNLKTNNNLLYKIIKIISFTKGKGFCGTIKKHHFSSNRASHGNSKAHNKPGSIGMCQTPGRILKGKKMSGRLGNNKTTHKKIIIIYLKKNILIIKGIISGNKNKRIKIIYE